MPALNYYMHDLLTAEHAQPGDYPVTIYSSHLPENLWGETAPGVINENTAVCDTEDELSVAARAVLQSESLLSVLQSLLAQINDTNTDGDS